MKVIFLAVQKSVVTRKTVVEAATRICSTDKIEGQKSLCPLVVIRLV